MARRQLETGVKNVEFDEYKGYKLRVVSGYNALADNWPAHLYLTRPGKAEEKIKEYDVKSGNLADALNGGFAHGLRMIDAET